MDQITYTKNVLIDEIGDIVKNHPFLSIGLMTSAIEFLGATIEKPREKFDVPNRSKIRFTFALRNSIPL
jgi:hypothetical protein